MRTSLRIRCNRSHGSAVTTVSNNTGRRSTKLLFIISVIAILAIGTVSANMYQIYGYTTGTSFTPTDAKNRLFKIFNDDRSDYGVTPAVLDYELSNRSYYRAMDVRDYGVGEDAFYTREDIFIVPQDEFGRSYYNSPGQFVDMWRNTDRRFILNELNRDNSRVGIGVVEGGGNFYIVIRWE